MIGESLGHPLHHLHNCRRCGLGCISCLPTLLTLTDNIVIVGHDTKAASLYLSFIWSILYDPIAVIIQNIGDQRVYKSSDEKQN